MRAYFSIPQIYKALQICNKSNAEILLCHIANRANMRGNLTVFCDKNASLFRGDNITISDIIEGCRKTKIKDWDIVDLFYRLDKDEG